MKKHEEFAVMLICTLSNRQGGDGQSPLSQVFALSSSTSIPVLAAPYSR